MSTKVEPNEDSYLQYKGKYDFLVLGANVFVEGTQKSHYPESVIGYYLDGDYVNNEPTKFAADLWFHEAALAYCCNAKKYGFSDDAGSWYDRINSENSDKPYHTGFEHIDDIQTKWNEISSKYRWEPVAA